MERAALRLAGEGVEGFFEAAFGQHFVEGGVGDDAALLDHDDTVAHGLDLLHDVGGEDDRAGLPEGLDQVPDVLQLKGVEA